MNILYLLMPLTLVLVTALVAIIIWAVQNGQFDDLNSPAHRILSDHDENSEKGAANGEGNGKNNDRKQVAS
jgi:cbb3-type cytochrome oxidase maturation protein